MFNLQKTHRNTRTSQAVIDLYETMYADQILEYLAKLEKQIEEARQAYANRNYRYFINRNIIKELKPTGTDKGIDTRGIS